MKKQYYFLNADSEICYTRKYFENYMIDNGLTELEVIEAKKDNNPGSLFFCTKEIFCGDGTIDYCGKQCGDYKPRNGKMADAVFTLKSCFCTAKK